MDDHLYQKKYRIPSTRLPERDYGSGDYFITICTKDKKCFFWEIINGEMQLNELGQIVENEILNTSKLRQNVIIDEFIVMPNHVHLILFIDRRDALHASKSHTSKLDGCKPSLQNENKFWSQINNLATIIRWLKWSITSKIQKISQDFWRQSRFYEHIIRNENELNAIREYILNNPLQFDINAENNSDF